MTTTDFKKNARAKLQGTYWNAFLVCIIAVAIMNVGSFFNGSLLSTNVLGGGIGFLVNLGCSSVGTLVWIASYVLSGALYVGRADYYLRLADCENPTIDRLFSHFKHFGNCFVMILLYGIYSLAWAAPGIVVLCIFYGCTAVILATSGIISAATDRASLEQFLFSHTGLLVAVIIVTIIMAIVIAVLLFCAYLRYALAPFILAENPEMSASKCMSLSVEMMKGNKNRLARLYLSFIGWYALCVLTCGVGVLFLAPYVEASVAEFFNEVSGKNYQRQMFGSAQPAGSPTTEGSYRYEYQY